MSDDPKIYEGMDEPRLIDRVKPSADRCLGYPYCVPSLHHYDCPARPKAEPAPKPFYKRCPKCGADLDTEKDSLQHACLAAPQPSARELAIWILSNCAFKYVHPDHTIYPGRVEQDVINNMIDVATKRVEAYATFQPSARTADSNNVINSLREENASLSATLNAKLIEYDNLFDEARALQQKISALRSEYELVVKSWKAEELVWKQNEHDYLIKQQQMQAGAEGLIEELSALRGQYQERSEMLIATRADLVAAKAQICELRALLDKAGHIVHCNHDSIHYSREKCEYDICRGIDAALRAKEGK